MKDYQNSEQGSHSTCILTILINLRLSVHVEIPKFTIKNITSTLNGKNRNKKKHFDYFKRKQKSRLKARQIVKNQWKFKNS